MKCHWMSRGSNGALSTISYSHQHHTVVHTAFYTTVHKLLHLEVKYFLLTFSHLDVILPKHPMSGFVGFLYCLHRLGLTDSNEAGLRKGSWKIARERSSVEVGRRP